MQIITSYFYPNKIEVMYDTDPLINTRTRIVYNRTLKLYKGVDNPVTIQVKNRDNKPVNITGFTVKFNLLNETGSNILVTKTATAVNATGGLASFLLTQYDVIDLQADMYNFSVSVTDPNGVEQVVYADDNYGVRGEVRVTAGTYPAFKASIDASITTLNSSPVYTSNVIMDSTYKNQSSNHIAQFFFDDFTGVINIQGTLDQIPATGNINAANYSWSTVASLTYANQTTTDYTTWLGNFTGIRFVITKTSGDVTKVLIRS